MKKSNANKATHSGTCQICGRLQKLPSGRMAKHGYTTRWGFFEGTCPGSDHQPFELACDRIEAAMFDAENHQVAIMAEVHELKVYTGNKAWVHNYIKTSQWTGAWKWERAEITKKEISYSDGSGSYFSFFKTVITGEGMPARASEEIENYSIRDLPAMVKELNGRYIREREKMIAQLRGYVEWQTKRLEGWKANPEALVPVK